MIGAGIRIFSISIGPFWRVSIRMNIRPLLKRMIENQRHEISSATRDSRIRMSIWPLLQQRMIVGVGSAQGPAATKC